MKKKMPIRKTLKKFWGIIPLLFVLCCILAVAAVQTITGDTLRSVPRVILGCIGICSVGVALLWVNTREKIRDLKPRLLEVLLKIGSAALFGCIGLFGALFLVFSYCPEHTVNYNGTKLVASVNSFLDVYVDYYSYKNVLFYGQKQMTEYYGSGGYDPFTQPQKPDPVRQQIYN